MKKIIFYVTLLLILPLSVFAITKPDPNSDMDSYSYVFYLYYDNGQIFADRDYAVKFDIINEKFFESSVSSSGYRVDIFNFKSEVVESITFDPRRGNPSFSSGKIQVKSPYVPNGSRATFYNNNQTLVNIFITEGSICNDDGLCDSAGGENDKTCTNDCKKATPRPMATPVVLDEGPDILMLSIYGAGGVGVVLITWFIWRWLKKRKEENFFLSPPVPPGVGEIPPPPPSS